MSKDKVTRTSLSFMDRVKLYEWFKQNEQKLISEDSTVAVAMQRAKAETGLDFTHNHFNGLRREMELKWRPSTASYSRQVREDLATLIAKLGEIDEDVVRIKERYELDLEEESSGDLEEEPGEQSTTE